MSEEELDYNLLEVEKGNRRFGVFIKNHIHDLERENQQLKEKRDSLVQKGNEYREKIVDLEIQLDKHKEVIDKAKQKSIYLQDRYGYILDDLTFLLSRMEGNNE